MDYCDTFVLNAPNDHNIINLPNVVNAINPLNAINVQNDLIICTEKSFFEGSEGFRDPEPVLGY